MPDLKEQGETDGEGKEAAHHRHELVEGLWDFQRDNEQGDGEGENGVAETLDTADFDAAPAEAIVATMGH